MEAGDALSLRNAESPTRDGIWAFLGDALMPESGAVQAMSGLKKPTQCAAF